MKTHNLVTIRPRVLGNMYDGFFRFLKESEEWLEWARNKSIFDQLESRRIGSICICPLLSTAGMGAKETSDFRVYYSNYCKPEWAFGGLGHEIAHTFGYDLTKNPPAATFDQDSRKFRYLINRKTRDIGFFIEDLCDSFARKFRTINPKEKIERDCKRKPDSLLSTFILLISNTREDVYTT